METKQQLSEETVQAVQELIKINADSHLGFTSAAEAVDDELVAATFRSVGAKRRQHFRELQRCIGATGEPEGSVKGAVHRWWLDLRAKASDGDPYSVLAEAERGEDEIKDRYEKLLKANPGSALSDVLHKHYREVKVHHDMIRDMRDRARA